MRVATNQLVPGCIVLHDVKGKTKHPMIPNQTVLTEEHISMLQFFLVDAVDVSHTLASGSKFSPEQALENKPTRPTHKDHPADWPLVKHIAWIETRFQKIFSSWQGNLPIDLFAVRELIVPLLERQSEIETELYLLHTYQTSKDYIAFQSTVSAVLSAYIANKLGYPKQEWIQIGLAAMLKDAGMAKGDGKMLTKPEALHPAEQEQLQRHPSLSYRMVESLPALTDKAKLAILQHHERLDGSGYPLGLVGHDMHSYSRMIAVADSYLAMVSDRPYKKGQSVFTAMEELVKDQYSKFDADKVQIMIKGLTNHLVGKQVLLSDQRKAEIVYFNEKQPALPIVRVTGEQELVTLTKEKDLTVVKLLD